MYLPTLPIRTFIFLGLLTTGLLYADPLEESQDATRLAAERDRLETRVIERDAVVDDLISELHQARSWQVQEALRQSLYNAKTRKAQAERQLSGVIDQLGWQKRATLNGIVLPIRGTILRDSRAGWVRYAGKDLPFERDRFRTGPRASFGFRMEDGTEVIMGENSELYLSEISRQRVSVELVAGSFEVHIRYPYDTRDFKYLRKRLLAAGRVISALRDTDLIIQVTSDQTHIECRRGGADIFREGDAVSVTLPAGERLLMDSEGNVLRKEGLLR